MIMTTVSNKIVFASDLIEEYLDIKSPRREELVLEFLNIMKEHCSDEDYKQCLQRLENTTGNERQLCTIHALLIIFDHLYKSEDYKLCCQLAMIADEYVNNLSSKQEINPGSKSHSISDSPISHTKMEVLVRLSSCYLQTGKIEESIELAKECLKLSKENSDKVIQISCLVLLANAFLKEKNFKRAILYNHLLLQIGRSLDRNDVVKSEWNNQTECQVLWNLSACYNSVGSIQSAVKYAEEYLSCVRFGSQENLIQIYSYLGSLQYLLDDFDSALQSHEAELVLSKKFNDRMSMAKAYGNLGLVYAAMGKISLANEFLEQELKIAKSLQQNDMQLNASQKTGTAKIKIGDIKSAIECFKTVYNLARESHDWKMQCLSYINIGKLYQKQGTLNFSRHYLEQGMNRANDLQMQKESIDAELHLAQVLKVLGYYEDARKHFKEVVLYFENILDTTDNFDILLENDVVNKLTSCCKDLQEVLVKLHCWQDALEIAELCHSRLHVNLIKKRKAACSEKAIIDVPRTFIEIEELLKKLPSNTTVLYYTISSTGFFLWMLRPDKGLKKFVKYNSLASHSVHELVRDCMKCLGISEKGGACCYKTSYKENLTDQWRSKRSMHKTVSQSHATVAEASVVVSEKQCKQEAANTIVQPQRGNSDFSESFDCKQGAVLNQKVGSKVKDLYFTLENNLLFSSKESSDIANNLSAAEREAVINKKVFESKEEAYDSGYHENNSSSEFCDSSLGAHVNFPKHASDNSHNKKSDGLLADSSRGKSSRESTFAESIAEDQSHENLLRELFRILLGKVEHLLPTSNEDQSLIIIPDGILNMLPFHLLIDKNGKALYQRFRISTLPCLALLAVENTPTNSETGLVFGNPCLQDACLRNINGDILTWEDEHTEQELLEVSNIFGCSYFTGKIATKENFIKNLSDSDIIHIATHGDNNRGCLLFTPNVHREEPVAERNSYVFDLDDLAKLKLNAKLVTLSSCDQCPHGVADSQLFEMNLVTGFLSSGARAVVMFLYTIPHEVLRIVIHQLYRLLEEGRSVSQSLHCIYNSMSSSEDYSHPGYWGGMILVGQDTKVDICGIRRSEFKRSVDDGTAMIRQTRELQSSISKGFCNGIQESKLFLDAHDLQMHFASLLRMENSVAALEALKDLLTTSITELTSFKVSSSHRNEKETLPAVAINQDLYKSKSLRTFLNILGFRPQPALFENDTTFLMLPPWNFDRVLEDVLTSIICIHDISLASGSAAFFLSQILPSLSKHSLNTLKNMINTAQNNPEPGLCLSDSNIQFFWAAAEKKRFLQHVGFHEIGGCIYLNAGNPYEQLQNSTMKLVISLSALHKKEKHREANDHLKLQKSYHEKIVSFQPWFAIRPTEEQNNAKQLLAKDLHNKGRQFRRFEKRGRHLHDATIESWKTAECHTIHIGPEPEEPEQVEYKSNNLLKVKVKPGGTPSSCRFPLVEKPKVTKYQCYKLREDMEDVFIERNRKLENRKRYEVCKLYTS